MKIALVGSAPSSVALGPYRDASYREFLGAMPEKGPASQWLAERWEIWGCSPGAMAHVPRADRWFEVHRWEPGQPWFQPAYMQFLQQFGGPVYVGGYVPKDDIPNALIYPIKEVEAEFSSYFLNSSLSLMLAMAIMEIEGRRKIRAAAKAGAALATAAVPIPDPVLEAILAEKDEDDTIGLWGVDMAAKEEYKDQRKGCHFFVFEALRRGIGVYVPPESDLLRPMPIYGLSEWDHSYIKATQRGRELSMQHENAMAAFNEAKEKLMHLAGYQQGFAEFIDTWLSPYGLPHGTVLLQEPGTGLGGGVTVKPGTPVAMAARMPGPENTVEIVINSAALAAAAAPSAAEVAHGRAEDRKLVDALNKAASTKPSRKTKPTRRKK